MQKIIDKANLWIETHDKQMSNPKNSTIEKNRHSYLLNLCEMFKGLAEELIEKEKQQIQDAYREGTYYNTIGNINFNSDEDYYVSTFGDSNEAGI